jgi:hypothetical protein
LKKKLMKMDDKEKTTPTITMRKRWNDGHQWERVNHVTGYTNVKKRFQWRGHNTFRNWFYEVHLQQSLTMPLKFTTIRIEKLSK